MRAIIVEQRFGLDQVRLAEIPMPALGPGQLRIRVRAASLNYRDILVARGDYNPNYPLPLILGSDAVGEVCEHGPGVDQTEFPLGSRVCPTFAQGWLDGPPLRNTVRQTLGGPLPGVFAEFAVLRSDGLIALPEDVSDEAAACLPCAGVTAWSALCRHAELRAGQSVLVLGSGGVSCFAISIARSLGLRVFATTRDLANKGNKLRELGADQVVDAQTAGWGRRVRELSGGEGVDHVIEVSGGATFAESLAALRPGGGISLIGVLGGRAAPLDVLPIVMRNLRVQGIFVGNRADFLALLGSISSGVRPVVDSVWPFERFSEAIQHMLNGDHVGKVVLRWS
ncbi:MAG TPA: NAD(P)-dependent alcohol dehydrogenase [Polyangiaceae bacterium]|nr:NAD(P)-dependent alcohol dehydrogenase [Polyangiaceae bacterium]